MKKREVTTPLLAAIAVTRGVMGVGAGMLLSKRIPRRKRERVGWTLLGLGVASTIPVAAKVFRRS